MLLALKAFNAGIVFFVAACIAAAQARLETPVQIPAVLGGRDTALIPSWLGFIGLSSVLVYSMRNWRVPTVRRAIRKVAWTPSAVALLAAIASAGTYTALGGDNTRSYLGALTFIIGLTLVTFVLIGPVASAGLTTCLLLCTIEYASGFPLASHLRVLDVDNPSPQLWAGGTLMVVGTIAVAVARPSHIERFVFDR